MILLIIFYVSVVYSYEVIPGCVPKMTPVNATHCRIEYEHCFKDLEPGQTVFLKVQKNTGAGVKFSSTIDDNLVNVRDVCLERKYIFLHINGGSNEADLQFSYTHDDFQKTILDYMCYSENNVTINMTKFRQERPDQHCLRYLKVRDAMLEGLTLIRDGFLSIHVEEELEIKIRREDGQSSSRLMLNKTALVKCMDKDLVSIYVGVGGSVAAVFVICLGGFLIYRYINKNNTDTEDKTEDVVHEENHPYDDPDEDYYPDDDCKVYTDDTHNTYYTFENAQEKREYLKQKEQQANQN